MNIEVKKVSYLDYVLSRYHMENLKMGISVLIIWAYIIFDMNRKNPEKGLSIIAKEYGLSGLILAVGVNIFVYLVVYFFAYRKALKMNPIVKGQITDNFINNFYIFGEKQKNPMRKYKEFNKIFEKGNGFYFNIIGRFTFFVPKKGLKTEEIDYLTQIVSKNKIKNGKASKINDKNKGSMKTKKKK